MFYEYNVIMQQYK